MHCPPRRAGVQSFPCAPVPAIPPMERCYPACSPTPGWLCLCPSQHLGFRCLGLCCSTVATHPAGSGRHLAFPVPPAGLRKGRGAGQRFHLPWRLRTCHFMPFVGLFPSLPHLFQCQQWVKSQTGCFLGLNQVCFPCSPSGPRHLLAPTSSRRGGEMPFQAHLCLCL